MVGILRGDASLNKKAGAPVTKRVNNVRISFKQSIKNFPFLWTVECGLTKLNHTHPVPGLCSIKSLYS